MPRLKSIALDGEVKMMQATFVNGPKKLPNCFELKPNYPVLVNAKAGAALQIPRQVNGAPAYNYLAAYHRQQGTDLDLADLLHRRGQIV